MAADNVTGVSGAKPPYSRVRSVILALVALAAVVSLFWFIQVHYESAASAGWGDRAQDRRHALLGWGIVGSAIAAVGFTFLAAPSRRVLFSLVGGAAVSGMAGLIGPSLPWAGAILGGPGVLASFFKFGPHSSGPVAYWFAVNMISYSLLIFLLIPNKKHPGDKDGWWPEKRS